MRTKYYLHVKVFENDGGINVLRDKFKASPEETVDLLKRKYVTKKDVFSVAADEAKELYDYYESRNKS